jgi:hypothetical protein
MILKKKLYLNENLVIIKRFLLVLAMFYVF